MLRSALAILAGFTLWTLLWLSSNASLQAMLPDAFGPDNAPGNNGILLMILLLSIVFSLLAGYVAALIAQKKVSKTLWGLALLQLGVGIFVQLQYWDVMPLWYHFSFLALLVPGILIGGRLRLQQTFNASVVVA